VTILAQSGRSSGPADGGADDTGGRRNAGTQTDGAQMTDDAGMSARDFGPAFKRFLEQATHAEPTDEPYFVGLLRGHFGADPALLPIVTASLEPSEHPNVQLAVDALVAAGGRSAELVGVSHEMKRMTGVGLAELVTPGRGGSFSARGASAGPVEYSALPLDEGRTLRCVQHGLYLLAEGDHRVALLLRGPEDHGFQRRMLVEVMAPDREAAEEVLAELRTRMREGNVYRGRVLSLSPEEGSSGAVAVRFHRLPAVARDDVVLPGGTLERIERHTAGVAERRERLLAAGRHLKRGILLYGPPGTGKTFTAMYLAGRMTGRTVLLLTGQDVGLIRRTCAMARLLQPSMVILEDVDLVAEERTGANACGPLLFELLNEMDGLADDADVVFLLTTNRADRLEPALAARPGRVDQAVEIPLPDAGCRRRLVELYGRGLVLRLDALDALVARTEGVSAAFVKELLRRAALVAADADSAGAGDGLVVDDDHVATALRELMVEGGALTRSLLGVRPGFHPPRGAR
jgi:hypothetical protein